MRRNCLLLLVVLASVQVYGQSDFTRQFNNGKELYKQGKYNLAMETLKPVIPYDQKNPYAEYATFYYALAAYKQGYKAVTKDMLNQIRTTYPKWDKMDEVNFWLAKVHFDNKDYFQGLKVLQSIQDKKFQKDIDGIKTQAFASIKDVETLRMMHEEYPKDAIIGRYLVESLSKNVTSAEDKELLEKLIEKFDLKRAAFIPEAPKTFFKDRYSVSVLLPFMVSTLDPTPSKKRNQILLDYYEGLKLAVDTLARMGVNISLRAYDTERSHEKIKKLLSTDELINTDMIIGPFFPEENKFVQEFSVANKVNMVHPFSNNTELIGNNPYAFLFQPSSETLGSKSAEYLASRVSRKNAMVFYGPNKKDSVLAANFVKKATEKGLNVVLSQKVNNREAEKILAILATPTEFDEFKYPSQFTVKKDSIGSIYVASDDALIYAKVVTAIETRADSIKVVGSENWLDDSAIDPEKFQSLKISMTAPNYTNTSKPHHKAFFRRFVRKYGRTPSPMARMGYEFMMFFGNQLKTNGVFFQDGLSKAGVLPGYLSEGFHYEFTRDNSLVPFIMMQDGQIRLIDKR